MTLPVPAYSTAFQPDEDFARDLDDRDPLGDYREKFLIPCRPNGEPVVYLCGHSLGLQPRAARTFVEHELEDWAHLGVEGHFRGRSPWVSYHEQFRDSGARLVGARPGEVVFMNGLTVNLHLLMTSFYRPTQERYRILTDEPMFPSDRFALQSQLRLHGYDPAEALLTVRPRAGEQTLRPEDIEATLEQHGNSIALVLWNGVNFFTGQWFDLPRLTATAQRHGCIVGLDLAHAAGNVVLQLHDWNVDFAVWCSYKYLNAGPGAVAGCFVHERHGQRIDLPRLAGWWGNDPATRFRMNQPDFVPRGGADGWQLSNPPILAMAPLRASLALFDQAGMPALRAKSAALTAYLLFLLDALPAGRLVIITPREPGQRGNQLSLLLRDGAKELVQALDAEGVTVDFREPNVIRVAPVPLYNSFHDVWKFAQVLARQLRNTA